MIPEAAQQMPAEKRPLHVAAYCRVSTNHEEQQHSLAAQINYYTNYIQNHPNWVLAAVYSDTASGTRTNQRPSYQKLMRDCSKRKVDLILVKSLSRFGRDALETIRQIRRLKKMNIGVYIENGGLGVFSHISSLLYRRVVIRRLPSTIDRMLSNEKYAGEVRVQKTFTADLLTGRREKNTGQLDSYLVEDAHEPIIDLETFELVQRIKGNIKQRRETHQI